MFSQNNSSRAGGGGGEGCEWVHPAKQVHKMEALDTMIKGKLLLQTSGEHTWSSSVYVGTCTHVFTLFGDIHVFNV